MNPLQDIFISYGRADSRDFAAKLNQRLVERGYTVWYDFEDIPQGVDYQKQIDDAIEKSDNFLFIIAPHATNSSYCRLEIERAVALNKRLVPIMHVEQIDRQTWQHRNPQGTDEEWQTYTAAGKHSCFTNIHPEIAKINWNQVSFREGVDDFQQSFQALVELIERQRTYVRYHTVLLNSALKWQRNQKQSRLLLTGKVRQQAEQWLSMRFTTQQAPCVPTDLHCEFITESIKNANNLMTQVFLCHAEQDREIAEQVRHSLMRSGITTWTHHNDIEFGSDFQAAMVRGMEEADNVLFLISSHSLASSDCRKELDHALSLHKRIIPLRVGSVDAEKIPKCLQTRQYIDLADNQSDEDYLQDESNLLRILQQDAAFYHEHKVLLAKALKWERQQRNPCILLRGYELQHAQAWLKLAQSYPEYGPIPIQSEYITESERQPSGINLDVFISYSRVDSDFARKLNDALQRQGKRTWFDQESIASGEDFQQEIYKGIEASDHFLFILSPKSVNSPYCADEVEHAATLNKRIITVRHEAVNATELHPELAKVQWIDFLGNNQDFTANLQELIRTLDADPEHLRFHTRLLMQAIDWQEKEQRQSLLLRDDELVEAEQWVLKAAGKQPRPTELQGTYVSASRGLYETNQRLASRRQGRLIGMLGSLLLIALLGGSFGFYQAQKAEEQRNIAKQNEQTARSRELVSKADLARINFLYTDVDAPLPLSTLLALESTKLKPFDQAKEILRYGLATLPIPVAHMPYGADGDTIVSSADGQYQGILDVPADRYSVFSNSNIEEWTLHVQDSSGQTIATLQAPEFWFESLQAISPDGRYQVKTGWADSTAKVIDLQRQEVIGYLPHDGAITAVAFGADNQTIITTSGNLYRELPPFPINGDQSVRIWRLIPKQANPSQLNLSQPRDPLAPSQNRNPLLASAISPNNRYLATAWDRDSTVYVADLETQQVIARLPHGVEIGGYPTTIKALAFSPDSQLLATASLWGDRFQVWDIAKSAIVAELELPGNSLGSLEVKFSANGQYLIANGLGTVQVLDLSSGEALNGLALDSQTRYSWAELMADNQSLLVSSWSQDPTLDVLNLQTGQVNPKLELPSRLKDLAISPVNSSVALAGEDGVAYLWNIEESAPYQTLVHGQDALSAIAFSPNGQLVATAGTDKQVKLWDTNTGKEVRSLSVKHEAPIAAVAFSQDGHYLATAANADYAGNSLQGVFRGDNTVRIWDIKTGDRLTTLEHEGKVKDVSFSADSRYIMADTYLSEESGFAPAHLWRWQISDLEDAVCARLPRNFTPQEWARYMENQAYRATCPTK